MLHQSLAPTVENFLKSTELCQGISDDCVKELLSYVDLVCVEKDQILYEPGTLFDHIIIVLDAELSIRINKPNGTPVEIRPVYKGGIIGENSFLRDNQTINYWIVASKEGSMFKISRRDLLDSCSKDKSEMLLLNLMRVFAHQLHVTQSRIHDLTVYKVEELLRIELYRLANMEEKKSDRKVNIVIPSNQELALRVGCHKRGLISALNKLRNTGELIRNRKGSRNLVLTEKFFEKFR